MVRPEGSRQRKGDTREWSRPIHGGLRRSGGGRFRCLLVGDEATGRHELGQPTWAAPETSETQRPAWEGWEKAAAGSVAFGRVPHDKHLIHENAIVHERNSERRKGGPAALDEPASPALTLARSRETSSG